MPAVPTLTGFSASFAASPSAPLSFDVPSNDGLSVVHDGVNASGVEDLNTIFLQLDDTTNLDPITSIGLDIIKLIAGRAIYLPKGPCRVFYRCVSGAPCFSVFKRR